MYNYGHLDITFDDGSVGWYEAGWGPMISETAHFVKDIIGPNGSVSIVSHESADATAKSADHNTHTQTNALRIHHAALDANGAFAKRDDIVSTEDEPGHQELCEREQRLFLKAIGGGVDLAEHHEDALNSLRIVFAADESVRTGEVIRLRR
jgi:predicted dehydrogenase